MTMSNEDRFLKLIRQLSENEKNSTLDFMEYLVARQTPNNDDDMQKRNQYLNEMNNFLHSLTTEKLSSLIWVFKGMEFALQTDSIKQGELMQKWLQSKDE